MNASVAHLTATHYVPSEPHYMERIFWSTPHTECLPGVHFSTTCTVPIEDCEGWWLSVCGSSVVGRAAERTAGAQGKYKMWGPVRWIVKGGLGARPQEILRFYML